MAAAGKSLVQSQFGRAAADYAASDVHAKGESLARIVELAGPERSWRALDIATGAGHTAAAFAPHVASIVAADITEEMLAEATKLAAERGLSNMTTAKADASALPFADGAFDLATCRLAAHHFPDLARFIAEAHRVLKPGGRLALVDNVAPDRPMFPSLPASELGEAVAQYNAFEMLRDPSHVFAPPAETWVRLLEASGFSILAREQFGKEIAFDPWVRRMRCPNEIVERLRAALSDERSLVARFLAPRRDAQSALHFRLQELLLVASKTGPHGEVLGKRGSFT